MLLRRCSIVGLGLAVSAASLTFTGCGADKAKADGGDQREAAASAMLGGETKHDKARKADEERRKKAFAERKAAEAAEADRVKGLVAGLVGLPDVLPADLESACQEVVVGYEDFFKTIHPNDERAIMAFYDDKRRNLGKRKVKCMKLGSIEAAACSVKAMAATPDTLGAQNESAVFLACAREYAPEALAKLGAVDVAE